MKNGQDSSPVGIGAISIVTVLLVLVFSIFAALTLSTARSDLALSQRNADTVRAYYAADSEATQLYAQFRSGTDAELDTLIPLTEHQALHLHLTRQPDGTVQVQNWQAVSLEDDEPAIDDVLPVWEGE